MQCIYIQGHRVIVHLEVKNNVLTSVSLRRAYSRAMLQKWKIASEKKSPAACNRRICRPAVGCSPDINFSFASKSSKLTPNVLYGMFFIKIVSLVLMTCVFSAFLCVFDFNILLIFFSLDVLEKYHFNSLFMIRMLEFVLLRYKAVHLIAVNISRSACFRCYQLICFYFSYMNFFQKCDNNCIFIFIPLVIVKLNTPNIGRLVQNF